MRTILCGALVAVGIGLAGMTSAAAAPINGAVISNAAAGLLTYQADCRRLPHRHRKGIPHGFGFGCPKKPKPAKTT